MINGKGTRGVLVLEVFMKPLFFFGGEAGAGGMKARFARFRPALV